MRDSLFKRYITAFGMTLLTCTMLLGLALLYFSAYNFARQKQQSLHQVAGTALRSVNENITFTNDAVSPFQFTSVVARKTVSSEFDNIYITTSITVYVCNLQGRILLCSEGEDCIHTNPVPKSILNTIDKTGSSYRSDYLEGLFKKQGSFSFGCAIFNENNIVGYLFTSTPVQPLYNYLSDMFVTFLVSTATMIVAATAIIYFATRNLVRPLHEITVAANKFGGGDFQARVSVSGEDEIAQLAYSFNHMADSLAEFENTRRGFVANVSHELRTPMTTIAGYVDGILDKTIPSDKEDHYLTIVSDEVKRLSRLTSSLLDISRIEEGAFTANLVNLNVWEVILSVMASCERRIAKQNIIVPDINDEPRYAMCDRDMLYQVVYNLIDNAVKFTPSYGTLSVASHLSGGFVSIIVHNTGSGISQQELAHIFERFYKVDKSRGLDRTGTGLGLYIVKTLTQKMGGDITVSSKYGEYAEFTVRLHAGTVPERIGAKTTGIKIPSNKAKMPLIQTSPWFKKKMSEKVSEKNTGKATEKITAETADKTTDLNSGGN